ncbi:MAG: arginine--tRNA ligase [Methanobacteriota archaeon]|nr:MAG: arginine--tRNA ligase [Euryarchaeota archaeon]
MGHDPWSELRDRAEQELRAIEFELHLTTPGTVSDAPEDRGLFSLATHAWAKERKQSPVEVAALIARRQVGAPFSALRAEGAYVNFVMEPGPFAELVLASVGSMGERYGQSPRQKERILLEHTSANPTGPLHVGRARNPFLGDALVRLLRFVGFPVKSEYLVNDIGRQMVLLYWAVTHLSGKSKDPEERVEYRYVKLYQEASERLEKDESLKREIEQLTQRFEGGDVRLTKDIRKIGEAILESILDSLRRVNVTFDSFFWESDAILDGSVQRVIERLMPLSKEEDGAHYIDLSSFGLEGDAAKYVFVRKDGTSLYTTRDIAYHLSKMGRCDVAINILGEDHKLTFQRLKAAFRLMGIDWAPETIFYAFVNLPEGRMSTRKGRVVHLDDLIDEALDRAYTEVSKRRTDLSEAKKREIAETIGISAVRYNIVRVHRPSSSTPMRGPAASSRNRTEAAGRITAFSSMPRSNASFDGSRSSHWASATRPSDGGSIRLPGRRRNSRLNSTSSTATVPCSRRNRRASGMHGSISSLPPGSFFRMRSNAWGSRLRRKCRP